MADEVPRLEPMCPAGGDVEFLNSFGEEGGWRVLCSQHGTLGYAPSMADCWPIARQHADGHRPTGTPRASGP